jgi:hypothetical protein
MTNPNYENHMVLEQDKSDIVLTTAEIKLEEQKQVARDAEIREKAESVFYSGDLNEIIHDRTRKDWLDFADDYLIDNANRVNLLSFDVSDSNKLDLLNMIRELSISAIIREMES